MERDARLPRPKTVVAYRLAEERKRMGLTQEELSERVYISTGLIRKCEQGERMPTPEYIEKMAEFFGCSQAYLTNKVGFRTVDEQKEFETWFAPYSEMYAEYKKAREVAIAGSSFLMELLGIRFETKQQPDSYFLTVILTSKDGERLEVPEPDFVEMLETFSDRSKDVMLDLLRTQKTAPGD